MKDQKVILVRRFFPAAPQRGDWEFLSPVAGGIPQHWRALENLYRVLILAEPGAGKTFEARHQARRLILSRRGQGKDEDHPRRYPNLVRSYDFVEDRTRWQESPHAQRGR